MIRLSQHLHLTGHQVILISSGGELVEGLRKYATHIRFDGRTSLNALACKILEISSKDVVITGFDPFSTALSFAVAQSISHTRGRTIAFSAGVFHPRDYFREHEASHLKLMNFFLGRFVVSSGLFFMNSACRESHAAFFRKNLGLHKVIPVPMEARRESFSVKRNERIRICSVGRIVPFKAYNFCAASILNDLNGPDPIFSWDIYGHGTHEAQLLATIQRESGGNCAFLDLLRSQVLTEPYWNMMYLSAWVQQRSNLLS